jgi:hypothetical protein
MQAWSSRLQHADFKDGNNNTLASKFTIAGVDPDGAGGNDAIRFTALNSGDMGAKVTIAIASAGGSNTATLTSGTSTVEKAGGTGISVIDGALATVAEEESEAWCYSSPIRVHGSQSRECC